MTVIPRRRAGPPRKRWRWVATLQRTATFWRVGPGSGAPTLALRAACPDASGSLHCAFGRTLRVRRPPHDEDREAGVVGRGDRARRTDVGVAGRRGHDHRLT